MGPGPPASFFGVRPPPPPAPPAAPHGTHARRTVSHNQRSHRSRLAPPFFFPQSGAVPAEVRAALDKVAAALDDLAGGTKKEDKKKEGD